jgi:hypothetical protein
MRVLARLILMSDATSPTEAEELRRLETELAETRKALTACEQELLEMRTRRSHEMARLEKKAYWLERVDIDPDAWLSHRPLRALFQALQFLRRTWRRLRRG